MEWFSSNFSTNYPTPAGSLLFYLHWVLQVCVGSGIAFVWKHCCYKLLGYCHTSGGFDSSWWANRFHFVMILYISVFPFISTWRWGYVAQQEERKSHQAGWLPASLPPGCCLLFHLSSVVLRQWALRSLMAQLWAGNVSPELRCAGTQLISSITATLQSMPAWMWWDSGSCCLRYRWCD